MIGVVQRPGCFQIVDEKWFGLLTICREVLGLERFCYIEWTGVGRVGYGN